MQSIDAIPVLPKLEAIETLPSSNHGLALTGITDHSSAIATGAIKKKRKVHHLLDEAMPKQHVAPVPLASTTRLGQQKYRRALRSQLWPNAGLSADVLDQLELEASKTFESINDYVDLFCGLEFFQSQFGIDALVKEWFEPFKRPDDGFDFAGFFSKGREHHFEFAKRTAVPKRVEMKVDKALTDFVLGQQTIENAIFCPKCEAQGVKSPMAGQAVQKSAGDEGFNVMYRCKLEECGFEYEDKR